ncbi:MAG: hypothetical protein NC397_00430 [Clostridium sp.]|nr:hypothetical protein [Clostridium sp.]
MKTKLSKKLLSAFLAVLMVITSIPVMSITAFAAKEDATVTAAKAAMTAFEDKLATPNASFKNVTNAYNAYVDCQEALDGYQYGELSASILTNATSALTSATAAIENFVPVTGNAQPSFPNTPTEKWSQWKGTGYQNVLYSPMASMQTQATASYVTREIHYGANAVLMYDGINTPILPIMLGYYAERSASAYSANKTRYVWSAYPADPSASDNTVPGDDPNWGLAGYWNAGDQSDSADWDWHWWKGSAQNTENQGYYKLGYNNATGVKGIYSTNYRSPKLSRCSRTNVGSFFSPKYDYSSPAYYAANALQFKGTPGNYGQSYNLNWFVTSGADNNNDTTNDTGAALRVVNYKTLLDALSTNGSKMKSISLSNYSEGGLASYIAAMDAAANFDPNTYFTSTDDYDGCINDMQAVVRTMNNADTSQTDAAGYENLRKAMNAKQLDYNGGVNAGFTTESWNTFVTAYNNAKSIMASLPTTSYNDAAAAQAAADALNGLVLVPQVEKMDTTALEAAINTFMEYENVFTTESMDAAYAAVENAKIAVWGSVDNYPATIYTLDDTAENQVIYANALAAVENAVKALRISPDGVTVTSEGRYSLTAAMALQNQVGDPTDYGNYATFTTALAEANEYIATSLDVDLTDYPSQLAAYKAIIEKVVAAYEGLTYSFTKIPDGTIANAGVMTQMTPLTSADNGSQSIAFDYTSTAVIIKTNRNPITVTYGPADITFGTGIKDKENNMLDSISINATASQINGQGGNNKINSNVTGSTPTALTDDQKATYAGCLTNGNFALTNIRYLSKSTNNSPVRLATLADGTQIYDGIQLSQMDLTDIIGTTNGASSNPGQGGVFARTTNSEAAYTYLTGDMTYTVQGTSAPAQLTATTRPTMTTDTMIGNFGAVTIHNCQNLTNQVYYRWMTSESTSEEIISQVSVVDISNLVDLVDMCNKIANTENAANMYTDSSWSNFVEQLTNAQATLDYTTIAAANNGANTLLTRCVTRYNNLWAAYEALVPVTFTLTFNYKNASGADTSATITANYGDTLNTHSAEYTAIANSIPSYVSGNYTYTWTQQWSPALDPEAPIVRNGSYTAQYDSAINAADFNAYNAARNALLSALKDNTYTAESLAAANAAVAELTYFEDASHNNVYADKQAEIDAETATLGAILNSLEVITYDMSVAKAVDDQIKEAKKSDPDMYADDIGFVYQESVDVAGQEVIGLLYKDQASLDAAISETVNALKPIEYTIYVNGEAVDTAAYGSGVIISSDGTVYKNVDDIDTDAYDGSLWTGWTYHYEAKTSKSADKYMFAAKSFGFVVRGNAYITTSDTSSDSSYIVTFKNESQKTIMIDVTDGNYTLPEAPARAFYDFVDYTIDGVSYSAGDVVTIDKNTVVTANYEPQTEGYMISFYESYTAVRDWDYYTDAYQYNDLVQYSVPGAYAYVEMVEDMDTGVRTFYVLSYGEDYSFYACRSYDYDTDMVGLVALTEDEYNMLTQPDNADYENPDYYDYIYDIICDANGNQILATGDYWSGYEYTTPVSTVSTSAIAPITSNGEVTKFTLIGSIAATEGVKVKETGFLFTTKDVTLADMTVENVGQKGIARMKSPGLTSEATQFVVNVGSKGVMNFNYVAYAIIENADGTTDYIYSSLAEGNNQF